MDQGAPAWVMVVPAAVTLLSSASSALTFYSWFAMSRFVRVRPEIQTMKDLVAYRQLATFVMINGLVLLGVGVAVPGLFMTAGAFGADVGWLTMAPMVLPLLFRKQIQGAERHARTLPVAGPLREAYASITRTWTEGMLPRFAALDSDSVARSIVAKFHCDAHGDRSGGACSRCSVLHCLACRRGDASTSTLCADCHQRVRARADELRPAVRTTAIASTALGALGVGDLMMGLLWLRDPLFGSTVVPWVLILLGLGTNVASLLWSNFIYRGREAAIAAALPQLFLFPVGTLVAGACLWVAFRHRAMERESVAEVLGAGVLQALAFGWSIAIGVAVILLHGAALALMGVFMTIALSR